MYEILFSHSAKEKLKELPNNIKNDIGRALERIKIRPFSFIKRLRNSPYYRLRVGNYRLITNIDAIKLTINIIELGHRKDIYK